MAVAQGMAEPGDWLRLSPVCSGHCVWRTMRRDLRDMVFRDVDAEGHTLPGVGGIQRQKRLGRGRWG